MRFAGEDDLHRAVLIGDERHKAVEIAENEVGAFVSGEAAREADGERVGLKEQTAGDHLAGGELTVFPLLAGAFIGKVHQFVLEVAADRPQFVIRDIEDAVPGKRVVNAIQPVQADVRVKEQTQTAGKPGGGVHTVGDVMDGHVFSLTLRPEEVPHLAGDDAMQIRNGVGAFGELEGEHGHDEGISPGLRLAAQVNELVVGQTELRPDVAEVLVDEPQWELVIAGGDGGVRGEDIGEFDLAPGVLELDPGVHFLADALDGEEGGVPFVHVPHIRFVAQQAQRAHAAHTQQDLLRNAHLEIVAVQAFSELAVSG